MSNTDGGFPPLNMLLIQDRGHTTYKRVRLDETFEWASAGWQLVCLVQEVAMSSYAAPPAVTTYAVLRRDPESEVARLNDELADERKRASLAWEEMQAANTKVQRVELAAETARETAEKRAAEFARMRQDYEDRLARLQQMEGELGAERAKLAKLVEVLGTDRVREILSGAP